jgi:hypothetical protein
MAQTFKTFSWAALDNNIEFTEKKFVNTESIKESVAPIESIIKPANQERNLSLAEIMEIDFSNTSLTKIIEYQTTVSKYLKSYLKQDIITNDEEKDKFINKLKWLHKSSEFICNKQKLQLINHEKNSNFRSSYKFCKYGYSCKHFIKNNKIINPIGSNCTDQHFVHNYLVYDIKNVIDYLLTNAAPDYNELTKSFNTIYFVFNHMKEEIDDIKKNYININLD